MEPESGGPVERAEKWSELIAEKSWIHVYHAWKRCGGKVVADPDHEDGLERKSGVRDFDLDFENESDDRVDYHDNDADGRGSDDHVHVHLVHVWYDADDGSDDGPEGEDADRCGRYSVGPSGMSSTRNSSAK